MADEEVQSPLAAPDEAAHNPLAATKKLPRLTKAVDAFNELAPIVGTASDVAEVISGQIHLGRVRAYALHQWETRGTDVRSIWRGGAPETATRKSLIPRRLFRPSAHLIEDFKDWNWSSGRFFVTVRLRPTTRYMMDHVRFVTSDIRALIKSYGGKTGSGGRPEKDAWRDVWMQVVRMAAAGQLTKAHQVGRDAFCRTVFEALGWDKEEKPPLAETTLKKVTGPVWDAIIESKSRR